MFAVCTCVERVFGSTGCAVFLEPLWPAEVNHTTSFSARHPDEGAGFTPLCLWNTPHNQTPEDCISWLELMSRHLSRTTNMRHMTTFMNHTYLLRKGSLVFFFCPAKTWTKNFMVIHIHESKTLFLWFWCYQMNLDVLIYSKWISLKLTSSESE